MLSLLRHSEESRYHKIRKQLIYAKLSAYDFTSSICKLIMSYLFNLHISVVVDSATSGHFPVFTGVLNGSVLSPTPFFYSSIIFSALPLRLFTHLQMILLCIYPPLLIPLLHLLSALIPKPPWLWLSSQISGGYVNKVPKILLNSMPPRYSFFFFLFLLTLPIFK